MSGYDVVSMMANAYKHYDAGKTLLERAVGDDPSHATAFAVQAQGEFLAGALAVDLARYANASIPSEDGRGYDTYEGGSRF